MSATPITNAPDTSTTETVEQRFRRLEAVWNAETQFLSDPKPIIEHPAFQEIIAMGDAVVPILLRELEKKPQLWVWALPRITGQSPLPPGEGGNIRKMSEAWVRWGREHGYKW